MKICLALIFLSIFSVNTGYSFSVEDVHSKGTFYNRSEYFKKYPIQEKNLNFFKELVKAPGRPLNSVKLVNIAYVSDGIQKSDYWRRSVLSLRARLNEIGVRYNLREYFYKVGDYKKSVSSISRALKDKPDYLIYTYDKTRKDIVERILKTKEVKVILQNITTPIRAWSDFRPFLYVGFDHSEGAKLLADYYLRHTKYKGSYSIFLFKEGYVNTQRAGSFIEHINKKSGITLNDTFYTNGRYSKTVKSATEYLKQSSSKQDKFVYACSTDIALGLSKVLKSSDRKNILINGWGGGDAELDAILKGDLDVTVMRMNDDNGVAMAEAIKYDILGHTKSIPHVYYGDYVLVRKGINPKALKSLRERAFRYSGVSDD